MSPQDLPSLEEEDLPLFQLGTEGDLGRGVAPATKDGCAMMNKRGQSFALGLSIVDFSSKREGFAWIATKEDRWFSSLILLSFLLFSFFFFFLEGGGNN